MRHVQSLRAPCGHHELPYGTRSRFFSDINKLCIITGHEHDDLGEDAVNAWSTCEAVEPEAAAVAGSEETRLSDGCLPVGRAEAVSVYFDIMMLTSHYLPTVGLLFNFFLKF